MTELRVLLKEHYDNYPEMEVQDAVKFLFQHHMGPGHLIADEASVLARLEAECSDVPANSCSPLYEEIGNGLSRLNLSACKAKGLSTKTIARLFCLTAQNILPDHNALEKSLDLVYELPFSRETVDRYLTQYRQDGCPMVSHSPRYRAAYSPAYRIVSKYYVNLIPVLIAVGRCMAEHPNARVAIDGPCASGKSTLGKTLADIYRCPLVHMDDFFLRPEQRTEARLAEPGGNVDYVRFSQEVLAPLLRNVTARYRPWQCHSQNFGPEITVEPGPLTIVEGSYALRPDLRERYHLRIWVEAPWEVRRQRLLERGGPDCLARFEALWIPLEDRYFNAYQVRECCHLTFSSMS